jgi:hypothetical protein
MIDTRDLLLITALAASVVGISGCSSGPRRTYEGTRLPVDQECRLFAEDVPSSPGLPPRIQFTFVDGKSTRTFGEHLFLKDEGPTEVMVQPGRHVVMVKYTAGMSFLMEKYSLECAPGDAYIAKARVEGYRGKVWLEDTRTGRPVGDRVKIDR